ncbi:MAG: UDP-3-O-(3-hydroxymyristoyl)glucosamine N-acyltransferase [Oligoflexia bacterium]|nr:UDP-3-O-(3-hydroxymyristoyl)glucosamine N-acyltransferase [Oligoflexia bacterium]
MSLISFKASEVCKKFGANLVGDPDFEIKAVGDPRSAELHTACFVSQPNYLDAALNSKSGFLVLKEDFYKQVDKNRANQKTFAITKNPYLFFVNLMGLFYPKQKMKPGVHPQAFVHPEAKLHANVQVGAFVSVEKNAVVDEGVILQATSFVGEGAKIGKGSIIYAGAKIYHYCEVGQDCIIHSGAVIGSDGFGFIQDENKNQVKIPQVGKVILGDQVEIGANTTIDRGTFEDTVIGFGVKIDNLVQIGHNCRIGDNTIICAHGGISGNTIIGKNCLLSGKVGTKGHLEIGDNVQIGGQSGISKDIPSNKVVKGYPAVELKEYLKIHALYMKLPEIYKRLIGLEKSFEEIKK